MKKLVILSTAALMGLGAIASEAQARDRGALLAAGILGGIAAGVIASQARAAPVYYAPVRRYVVVHQFYKSHLVYVRPAMRRVIIERRYEAVPVF